MGKRKLKVLGYIMRNEGLEILTPTGYTEGKYDRRKQCITYLASKWLTEQDFGEVAKRTKFTKSFKGPEIEENHDHQYTELRLHIIEE